LEQEILQLTKSVYGSLVSKDTLDRSDILSVMEAKVAHASDPVLVPPSFAPHNLTAIPSDPLDEKHTGPDAEAARLHYADLFRPDVARRRALKQAPSAIHEKLTDIIGIVQTSLLNEIRKRGVTIETNPSSNMRMERIKHPSELPVITALLDPSARTKVTICTDNPGTYDINIETEYAVVHDALIQKLGVAKPAEALEVLENVRRAGRDLFAVLSSNSGVRQNPRQRRTTASSKS